MRINKYSDLEQLENVHIFEYYDFPLFFISRSPNGELYLNYYIEELEANVDKWLFSRITNKERLGLIQQRMSVLNLLKKLFKKERLFHLFIDSSLKEADEIVNTQLVNISNFDDQSFPIEDFYVEYDFVSNTELIKKEEDIIDISKFKMVLNDENNNHDIELDLFLSLLIKFKKSLNDIAYDVGSKIIGNESQSKINLKIDSLQPSSFGIWLKSEPSEADLFEVPEKSLSYLFEIIEGIHIGNSVEIEERIEIDEDFSVNTIKSIKNLLKEVLDYDFSLKLEAHTKSKESKAVRFDKDSYNRMYILNKILEDKSEKYTEKVEIEGILTSINTSYNRFRISTTSIGEIGGKMSKEIIENLKNDNNLQFRVPSFIKATVEIETINDHVDDIYDKRYTLIYFEQPE